VPYCPYCGASVAEDARYCSNCGHELRPKPRYCPSCGKEVKPEARFCPHCGARLTPTIATVSIKEPTTEIITEHVPGPGGFRYASVIYRFVALLIDSIIIAVIYFILALLILFPFGTGLDLPGFHLLFGLPYLLFFVISFLYFFVQEASTGQTIGKRLMNIRVVMEDGSPCTGAAALIRNLLRIIDGLICYIVGLIVILVTDKHQRIGDILASTIVIAE